MSNLAERLASHFAVISEQTPPVPEGVEWLLPLQTMPETAAVFHRFLEKYYADDQPRTLILGINPGRFGAGVTNVAFTDPVHLERECGIENTFQKREELSAVFVYKAVHAFGGVAAFYRTFFINSVVPFGFVKDGKNYNYYDEKPLMQAMLPYAAQHLEGLLTTGMRRDVCFCLGEGKNFEALSKLNVEHGFFEQIVPLPHPRFVMQYRRKNLEEHVGRYLEAFRRAGRLS